MTSHSKQKQLPDIPGLNIHNNFQYGDLGKALLFHGQVYNQEYGFNHEFEAYVAGGLAEFANNYIQGKSSLWIAECKNDIIGSIAILERKNKQAQLRWFLVHPHYQGLSLGRYLFQEAIDFSRNAGYESIFLWTLDNLLAAKHIYEANGFRKEQKKKHFLWGRQLEELYYVLKLKK